MRIALSLIAALAFAGSASAYVEKGVHRQGATYERAAAADAEGCRKVCAADGECLSWTYVHPGVEGPDGVCELKSTVAPALASPCCDSGLGSALEAKDMRPVKATEAPKAAPKAEKVAAAADPVVVADAPEVEKAADGEASPALAAKAPERLAASLRRD